MARLDPRKIRPAKPEADSHVEIGTPAPAPTPAPGLQIQDPVVVLSQAAPVPEPAPPSPPPPPSPEEDAYAAQRAENERLRQELAEIRAERQREREERERAVEEAELSKALDFGSLDLVSLDHEDAKKITEAVHKSVDFKLKNLERKLGVEAPPEPAAGDPDARQRHLITMHNRIKAEVPQFEDVIRDPKFKEFCERPAYEGADLTVGSVIRHEHDKGKTAYIVSRIREFLGQKPSPDSIAQVAGTGSRASVPREPADAKGAEKTLFDQVRNREIDVVTYRRKLQELRAPRAT